jgi:hypothetical protein
MSARRGRIPDRFRHQDARYYPVETLNIHLPNQRIDVSRFYCGRKKGNARPVKRIDLSLVSIRRNQMRLGFDLLAPVLEDLLRQGSELQSKSTGPPSHELITITTKSAEA